MQRYKDRFWKLLPICIFILLITFSIQLGGAQVDQTPWPMFQHDKQHTGRTLYTGPENPVVGWSFTTEGRVQNPPAIANDGTIYFSSGDHKIYALNPNGSLKWSFETEGRTYSTPAIGSKGTVYVGSLDKKLYAINPDGTKKWSFTTGSGIYSSPAIADNGTIYVGSIDGKLYAITTSGTLTCTSPAVSDGFLSSPAIDPNGTIYIGSVNAKIYAFNPDCSQKWSYSTAQYYGGRPEPVLSSPAIGVDGTVYVGSDDWYIYALNPNGSKKWDFYLGDMALFASPAIGTEGTIYIGSGPISDKLFAINPDGSQKWAFNTGSMMWYTSPAIDADGTIYIGTRSGHLFAINPDGSQKWMLPVNSDGLVALAIGANSTLYVGGSSDHKMYAITDASTSGLSQSIYKEQSSQFSPSAIKNIEVAKEGLSSLGKKGQRKFNSASTNSSVYFLDDFAGTSLNSDVWATLPINGPHWFHPDIWNWGEGAWIPLPEAQLPSQYTGYEVHDSKLELINLPSWFHVAIGPFIYAKGSPFPPAGDFVLELRVKYDRPPVVFGAQIGNIYVQNGYPTSSGDTPPHGRPIIRIFDSTETGGITICSFLGGYNCWHLYRMDFGTWHTYKLKYKEGQYRVYFDDSLVLGPYESNLRPNTITIGDGARWMYWASVVGPDGNRYDTRLNIDYIKVEGEGTSAVFKVTEEGNVYADQAYYGQGFETGDADVAECIKVSEPVEPGNVVALDPENPGEYRKSRKSYSTLASGVISTQPGFTLGIDKSQWDSQIVNLPPLFNLKLVLENISLDKLSESPTNYNDTGLDMDLTFETITQQRISHNQKNLSNITLAGLKELLYQERTEQTLTGEPLLALMGVVPVKATTENGPIKPGDLLTTSSKPGYAMACKNKEKCAGAIIGKALESLEEGVGVIEMLVVR